jgi:uncharacterized protein (DUF433 family)
MVAITGLVGIGDIIQTRQDYREGRPFIAGTGMSVGRIAVLWKEGLSAEQIVDEKPPLTLAQVHAALAYYFANRDKIDADLIALDEEYERMAAAQAEARARGDRSLG